MATPAGFPARLLRLRAEAGMTQKDLALASGVSVPQIARYETGASRPRLTALVKLARALNVDVEQLENAEDEPEAVEIRLFTEGGEPPLVLSLRRDLYDFLESESKERGVPPEAMLMLVVESHMSQKKGFEVDEDQLLSEIVEDLAKLPPCR